MSVLNASTKAAVSVSQMSEMCQLSRSRWYEFLEAGVFPKPVLYPSAKRPIYDRSLQEKCLEIRSSGIGLNGTLILFNRKSKGHSKAKRQSSKQDQQTDSLIGPVIEAIKSLGLNPTTQAVCDAIAELYPSGIEGLDQGDVIRKTFLLLQGKRP